MNRYEFLNRDPDAAEENLFEKIPAFRGDVYHTRHSVGNGVQLMIHWNCEEPAFIENRDALIQSGFSVWQENEIGDNKFATLVNGEYEVTLAFLPHLSQIRRTVEPRSTLPIRSEDISFEDRGFKPTVTQLYSDFSDCDCGMSYICLLCDGSFAVIDGGWDRHGEAEQLYRGMVSRLPAGEKPVIAFWVLTHIHPDHINCFKTFAKEYRDRVTVEAIVYNNPGYRKAAKLPGGDLPEKYESLEEAVALFPAETKVYKPHIGQVYHVRNAVFECFYTQEELSNFPFLDINDSSIVFRMTLGDKSVMWFADACNLATQIFIPVYKDALKSDIVQVAHHGYGNPIWAIYGYTRPKIALWAVPEYRTATIENLTKFLKEKIGVEEFYFAYDRDHTIEC